MSGIVKGIDHVIVMVRDLRTSERTWQGLGFHTTPRGYHDTGGTANHLVMLDRTYLELLGLADPSTDSPYRRTMEQDPGPAGLALAGTAAETYRYWQQQGLAPAAPESLSRGVQSDGRPDVARFELTRLPHAEQLPLILFCCEHRTPHLVWQADAPPHPNGARSLEELVIVARDGRALQHLERITGQPAARSADGGSLALRESRITCLSPQAFLRRFGPEAGFRIGARPTLAAIVLASTDVPRAHQLAQSAGWRAHPTAVGGVAVAVPSEGVVIEWVPAP